MQGSPGESGMPGEAGRPGEAGAMGRPGMPVSSSIKLKNKMTQHISVKSR